MRVESTSFTRDALDGFLAEMRRRDRDQLLARLRAGRDRLLALAPRITEAEGGDDGWSAKEVLAHVAVMSKAYGTFGTLIAKGRLEELSLLPISRQRDLYGQRMVVLPVLDIVATGSATLQRTIDSLEGMAGEHLGRSATTDVMGQVTAAELLRLLLCCHLEEHLEQLEAAVRRQEAVAGN